MALLSANGLIAVTWVDGLTALVASRVGAEVGAPRETFAQAYADHMRRTTRFLPCLRAPPRAQATPDAECVPPDGD